MIILDPRKEARKRISFRVSSLLRRSRPWHKGTIRIRKAYRFGSLSPIASFPVATRMSLCTRVREIYHRRHESQSHCDHRVP